MSSHSPLLLASQLVAEAGIAFPPGSWPWALTACVGCGPAPAVLQLCWPQGWDAQMPSSSQNNSYCNPNSTPLHWLGWSRELLFKNTKYWIFLVLCISCLILCEYSRRDRYGLIRCPVWIREGIWELSAHLCFTKVFMKKGVYCLRFWGLSFQMADRLIQRQIHSCWGQLHLVREQNLFSWIRGVLFWLKLCWVQESDLLWSRRNENTWIGDSWALLKS